MATCGKWLGIQVSRSRSNLSRYGGRTCRSCSPNVDSPRPPVPVGRGRSEYLADASTGAIRGLTVSSYAALHAESCGVPRLRRNALPRSGRYPPILPTGSPTRVDHAPLEGVPAGQRGLLGRTLAATISRAVCRRTTSLPGPTEQQAPHIQFTEPEPTSKTVPVTTSERAIWSEQIRAPRPHDVPGGPEALDDATTP